MNISTLKTDQKKEKPNPDNLGFGNYFTDHMFVMDYEEGKGWIDPRIVPYAPLSIDPSAMVFHYGQSVFEGLKAYLSESKEILLFRPEKNIKRLNKSSERLCMPPIDEEFALNALKELVNLDKDWIPTQAGNSLYIRPFVIATESSVGVRASSQFKFIIILSPVGAYYSEGFNPVRIHVEQKYVRAVKGGIGSAKAAGNYAASLKAQSEAKKHGFAQVLWLDGIEHKYVEEVGTMNVFFKIKNEIITPELNGSILEGVTRSSVIQLIRDFGYNVTERKISIDEIIVAHENGDLEEIFGTGTAAVISPVGEISIAGKSLEISMNKVGDLSQKLYDTLTGIQTGKVPDKYNWITKATITSPAKSL